MDNINVWLFPSTRMVDAIRFRPASLGVFLRCGIDPWQDQRASIREICFSRSLDLPEVMRNLENLPVLSEATPWEKYPCYVLIDFLSVEQRLMIHSEVPGVHRILDIPMRSGADEKEVRRRISEALVLFTRGLQLLIQEEAVIFTSILWNENSLLRGMAPKPPESVAARLAAAQGNAFEHGLVDLVSAWDQPAHVNDIIGSSRPTYLRAAMGRVRSLAERAQVHRRLVMDHLYPKTLRLKSELSEYSLAGNGQGGVLGCLEYP